MFIGNVSCSLSLFHMFIANISMIIKHGTLEHLATEMKDDQIRNDLSLNMTCEHHHP